MVLQIKYNDITLVLGSFGQKNKAEDFPPAKILSAKTIS